MRGGSFLWILHGEIYMRENWFIFVDAAGRDFGGSCLRIPWEGISLGFKSEEAHDTMVRSYRDCTRGFW